MLVTLGTIIGYVLGILITDLILIYYFKKGLRKGKYKKEGDQENAKDFIVFLSLLWPAAWILIIIMIPINLILLLNEKLTGPETKKENL